MSGAAETVDEIKLDVPGMDCPSCAGKIETTLGGLDGIARYETRPTTGTVIASYDAAKLSVRDLVAAIERTGYEVANASSDAGESVESGVETVAGDAPESVWKSERAIKTWISGGVALIGLLVEFVTTGVNAEVTSVLGRELFVADLLFLAAVGTAGTAILRSGYFSLRSRNLDIDLLMSIAILGALAASLGFGAGLYLEAALLAVLFSVAELLERYSIDRARNSMRELMDLSPDEATVRRDGESVTLPVDDVEIGDVVLVRPSEKIPMDGTVVEGESAVNQAPITGSPCRWIKSTATRCTPARSTSRATSKSK